MISSSKPLMKERTQTRTHTHTHTMQTKIAACEKRVIGQKRGLNELGQCLTDEKKLRITHLPIHGCLAGC